LKETNLIDREFFSKIPSLVEYPDLLDIQRKSFQEFLQEFVMPDKREEKGLQAVFLATFPIVDSRENFILDFVEYYLDKPKYTVRSPEGQDASFYQRPDWRDGELYRNHRAGCLFGESSLYDR